MFGKLFGGASKSPAHQAGQELFQQGMEAAKQYRTTEAMRLYSKSFETNPNPAPLINRAKLYRWRLLFAESIRDLEIAQRLDKQQGDEFSIPIGIELKECKFLAQNRFNGKRDLFITDLKSKGFDYVAERLTNTIFKGEGFLLGYHVMNEVDNVKKFENIADFPSVKHLLENDLRDHSVIDKILSDRAGQNGFEESGKLFQMMLCVYDYSDMAKIRDLMIQKIWALMNSPNDDSTISDRVGPTLR